MLTFYEARKTVLQAVPTMPIEIVHLHQASQRVLATDVVAEMDLPPFDNSSMDGYAIRSSDTAHATDRNRIRLDVVGEVSAGQLSEQKLQPGAAVQIMTGAPMPDGADAVIEQELVESLDGVIELRTRVAQARNVRKRGEGTRKGEIVLRKGTRLTPAGVGVLASLGIAHTEVYARPTVALLTTGSEIVEVEEPLAPGKIRNSNAYTLWGLVAESGANPVDLGKAADDEEEIRSKIQVGLRHDLLVISGGISVGKHDLVLRVLEELGVTIHFWKVNIKPGMPTAFGVYRNARSRDVPVFALPGNPVSTMVTFLQFVRPALMSMTGETVIRPPLRLFAKLDHEISKSDGKRHFSRGIVWNDRGELFVRTTGSQSSGMLSSLVAANCLIVIPEEHKDLKAGDEVEIELL
jgi:molybdopterin molybdotransferase